MMRFKDYIKGCRGSATVYLLISFLALILSAGVLTDLARIRLAQYQLKKSVNSAARSVMAGYDPGLRQSYGLFARKETGAAEEFDRYLQSSLNVYPDGFFMSVRYEKSSLGMNRSLDQMEILKDQILEDMKYKDPVDFFSKLYDILKQISGVTNFFKNSNEMKKSIDLINGYLEELNQNHEKIKVNLENLVQYRERIKTLLQERERVSPQGADSIDKQISRLRELCQKAENEIEMAFQRAERLKIELELEIKKLETKFTAAQREQNQGNSGYAIQDLVKQQDAVHQNLSETIKQYKKDLSDISLQLEISREKFKNLRANQDRIDITGIGIDAASKAQQRITQNREKAMPEEDKNLLLQETARLTERYRGFGDNINPHKEEWNANGDSQKGDRVSETFDVVSKKLDENPDIHHLRDELYIDQYVLTHFTNLTTGTAGDDGHPFRSHEAEYICYGEGAINATLSQLYLMRTALDAATYFAFTKYPVELLQRMLYALAMGALQAVADVYILVAQNEMVPVGNMIGQNPLKDMTLSYRDHLRILFLLNQDEKSKLSRITEVLVMRSGVNPEELFSNMQGNASASLKLWFMPALGFGNMERGPFGTRVEKGVCYIGKRIEFGY